MKEIFFVGLGLTVVEHQKGTETRNHVTIHGNDAINVPLQKILLAYVQKNCSHFAYKMNVYHFAYTWYDLEGSSRDKADFDLLRLTAQVVSEPDPRAQCEGLAPRLQHRVT